MHTCWPFIWPQIHSRRAYWKGGWLQRRSPHICHASPQPAGQIDFEPRVKFTIGLNFELLLLRRPRSNNQITREKRKVFVKIAKWHRREFRVWDWRALAFRSLQAWAGRLGHWTRFFATLYCQNRLLKKNAFSTQRHRIHKRLCHLRIDNGNENSPAWIIHRAGIIERG